MNEDSYDQIRRAVIQIMGPRPSAERRRQIAADLRALAEQQERMAERENERHTASPTSAAPRPCPAPERVSGMYIRVAYDPDPLTGARRVRLSIGKQVWLELGSPERIDVQRVGPNIWIVEALMKNIGYQLMMGGSLPSCIVPDTSPVAQLEPGRYTAALHAGAIVIGEKVG